MSCLAGSGDAILIRMAEMIKSAYAGVEGTFGRMESDNFVVCFAADLLQNEGSFVRSGDIVYESEGTEYHFSACYGLYVVEDKSVSIASMVKKPDCHGYGEGQLCKAVCIL